MANPPLPMIASNTEETAFAVLEGNEILEQLNVSILDMSKKMTTSIGHLTGAFMSFTEMIKEQNSAMLAKLALAPGGNNDGGDKKNKGSAPANKGLVDNITEKGLFKAAGMSIMASLSGIFTNMTTWLTGIVTTFTKIGKNIIKFGKLGGRLFLPITLIIGAIGAVSASWESFANGDIWGGLEKAVTGFFNSVVTIPLDLIKDGIAWLLKKMGFDEAADVLNSFSFTEEFNKIVSKIFDGVKEAFKVITDLFTFGEEDKTALGLLGKLTDIIYAPINMAIGYIRGIFGWSEEGEEPFKLQDWIVTKTGEVIEWVKGLFSWAGTEISEGWSNLTDFVSQKWTDIKTWFTGKLEWATGAIGEGWTSLTDFVSQKWEDIKTWFGDKLTMAGDTIDSTTGFITSLVTDAWESVKKWFSDALSGIADALPSWDGITAGIISKLPSWMVPDSFKTPGMIADELREQIAKEQGRIDRSNAGVNEYYGFEDSGRAQSAENIRELNNKLAEAVAAMAANKGTGDTNIVTTNNNNSSGGGRSSPPIVIREGQPVGGRSAYLATGRVGF